MLFHAALSVDLTPYLQRYPRRVQWLSLCSAGVMLFIFIFLTVRQMFDIVT